MKKSSRSTLVVLAIFLAIDAAMILPRLGDKREIIPWHTDLVVARAEAATVHRPLLLDFTASWCGPCQDMRRTTWSDPAVAAALAGKIPVQIDIDQHPDIAQKYGVSGIPHLVLLDEGGNVIKTSTGRASPEQFIAWLNARSAEP